MDRLHLISASPKYGGRPQDCVGSLKKDCQSIKNIWTNPWNQDHVVLQSSTSLEHLQGLSHSQINFQSEDETDSIIVVIGRPPCYGLKDKVSLLFQWRKNGGDQIHETKKIGDGIFQITFTNGWHAVKKVCSYSWKIDDDKSLKIEKAVPFFKSFKNINDSASKNNDSQDAYDVYQEIDNVGDYQPLSYPSNSPSEVENQQERLRGKRNELCFDKTREEYLKRFYPEKLEVMNNRQHFKDKNHFNTIANLGPILQRAYTLSFPCVTGFLSQEREHIRKIEDEHKCLIKETSGQRDTGRINFSVTLLVTTTLEKSTIHLIQGSSKKIKADANFHIKEYEYGPLERNLSHLSQQNLSSLAISVSSGIADEWFLDEFAFWIVSKLKCFFGNKSKMHIFLCEYKNSALVEAYKYTLLSLQNKKQFDPIDLPMWEMISKRNFFSQFNELKSKVHLLNDFPNNFSQSERTTTLICLPILQNLDPYSCPYRSLKKQPIDLEKSLNSLKYTMTEEDLFNFSVGQIYKLKIPSHLDIVIAVYCSQVWDFDVAKSIEYSFNNCLEIEADERNWVAYIFPPGICPGYQYPVEFTVQKCLQALSKKIDTVKKFNSVNLVVPDKNFYDSFNQILNKKQKKFAHDVLCDPELSVSIIGTQERNIDATKAVLVTKLKKHMEHSFVEIEPICLELFKKKIQASPPEYVQVTVKRHKVRVAGLRTCDVDLFLKEYECSFGRQLPSTRSLYEWKRLSVLGGHIRVEAFKDDVNGQIEVEFQHWMNTEMNAEIQVQNWRFSFIQMTCNYLHKGDKFHLLRNEILKGGFASSKKSSLLEVKERDESYKRIHLMLKEHLTFHSLKVQEISCEKIETHFQVKESTKLFKKRTDFWHRIAPEWQSYIPQHGFQKLFSYCCSKAMGLFSKNPALLFDDKETDTESRICLLLCDVLFIEDTYNRSENKSIAFKFTDLSDAQVLPKFVCTVTLSHYIQMTSPV